MPYGDYTKENNFGELTGCNTNTDGARSKGRPAEFCDSVTCQSTLDVSAKSTLNETEVIPPAITVGGQTFVPTKAMIAVIVGTNDKGQPITQSTPMTILAAQG